MGVIRLQAPVDDNGRVTAGIPSLDSPKRHCVSRQEAKREYKRALRADAEQKREAAVAPDGSRPTTIYDAQKGIELTSAQIIQRLRILNPVFIFERSNTVPDVMGIYVPDKMSDYKGLRFICGFEAGISPEFEVREYEVEEVPDDAQSKVVTINGASEDVACGFKKVKNCTGTKRGWRSLLLRLMKDGFITKAGVDRLFGAPGRDSRNWQLAIS